MTFKPACPKVKKCFSISSSRRYRNSFFGGGTVHPIEGVDGDLQRKLDREAGIDAVLFASHGVYGIASRIQFDENYRTFTIRKERESGRTTEWEKLQQSLKNASLMPSLTVQAYVDRNDNRLLGAAVTCTVDLVRWIERNPCETKTTGRGLHGQADFLIVPWDSFRTDPTVRFRELVGTTAN